jgi:putative hydrolase of HD superfamily
MDNSRLNQQMKFLIEIDKLKQILRRTKIIGGSRHENDAEHSWHLAMMAMILLEHANEKEIDLLRVLKMLLIHDLVEIDAGDTFAYDEKGHEDKQEREEVAAKRIFGLLPEDQREEVYGLWREFEERKTPEARYANAIDRLHPMILNYMNTGDTWQKYGITKSRVIHRNQMIENGSATLWNYAVQLLNDAVNKGILKE